MSDKTKHALAESLINVLADKPLDRITISDITNDCGVNRQTFYYHFHDIYELIEWIYVTNAFRVIGDNNKHTNYADGLLDMFNLMLENKDFILKTYHSRSGGNMQKILLEKSYVLLQDAVTDISQGYAISSDNMKFIADFYKFSYTGIIMEWIDREMCEEPKLIIDKVNCLMHGNILEAVKRLSKYEEENRTGKKEI